MVGDAGDYSREPAQIRAFRLRRCDAPFFCMVQSEKMRGVHRTQLHRDMIFVLADRRLHRVMRREIVVQRGGLFAALKFYVRCLRVEDFCVAEQLKQQGSQFVRRHILDSGFRVGRNQRKDRVGVLMRHRVFQRIEHRVRLRFGQGAGRVVRGDITEQQKRA